MLRRLAALFLVALVPGPARAEITSPMVGGSHPVRAVVELFTSQGCSSCPPADALLRTYVESGDVMALTLPIDYWDYIGWKDTLASPRNSERQRGYAKHFASGPVYTPQVVVNGAAQALGSSRREIDGAIAATADEFAKRRVPVGFWNLGNSIVIETGMAPEGADIKEATIWLAVLQKSATVSVKRGENGGRSLTYYNVVRDMAPVGLWNGKPTTIRLARSAILRPEFEESIVLIQEANNGPIVGAAWLNR